MQISEMVTLDVVCSTTFLNVAAICARGTRSSDAERFGLGGRDRMLWA